MWATAADVLAVTGQVRDDETIAIASSMISTYAEVWDDQPETSINEKDRRHLIRATSWQAAWLTPTRVATLVTEREATTSVSADAVRIDRDAPADVMLAPMAQRELKSLSWVGTRSTETAPRAPVYSAWDTRNFLNEASDPPWLGSGYP
jgi:hypothetical protein